jgi:hypothetical protein
MSEILPLEELRRGWGQPVFWQAPGPIVPPLNVADVQAIVTDGRAKFPQVAVLEDGDELAPAQFTTSRRFKGLAISGFLDLDRVRAILARGGSLKLSEVERYSESMQSLCTALSEAMGLPFSVYLVLSPPGRSGYAVHRDPIHVVALQLHGRKVWEVYSPLGDGGTGGLLELPEGARPQQVVDLGVGDVLYLPPGWPHRATSEDDWSLHASFGGFPLETATLLRSVVEDIVTTQFGHEEVDLDPESGAVALNQATRRLLKELESTDWSAVLRRARSSVVPAPEPDLSDILPLEAASPDRSPGH